MTFSPRPGPAGGGSGRPGADRARLRSDLEQLGLAPGATVLVHASLRRISPDGGPATVAAALLDALGERGTLVVPAQTTWNSPSSRQYREAVSGLSAPEAERYRARLAAFDPLTTPSSGMGAVAEYVRTMPGALRSAHPHSSFAAVGARAHQLTTPHDLDCHLGERSPLGALYREPDGWILHLGTDFRVATIFHLAEYRYARPALRTYQARVLDPASDTGSAGGGAGDGDGDRAGAGDGWVTFEDIAFDDGDFAALGRDFEARSGAVRRGPVGAARALLYPARAAADFAVGWMRRERRGTTA